MSIAKRAGFRTLTLHGEVYRWRTRNEGWNAPVRAVVLLERAPSCQVIFDAWHWQEEGGQIIPRNVVYFVSRALVGSLVHLARSRGWPDEQRVVRVALDATGALRVIEPRGVVNVTT